MEGKGLLFSLESVYQGKEFRRGRVVNEIKSNLETKKTPPSFRRIRDIKNYFTYGNNLRLF